MNGGRQFIPQCCCPVASGVDVVLSLRAAIAVSGVCVSVRVCVSVP